MSGGPPRGPPPGAGGPPGYGMPPPGYGAPPGPAPPFYGHMPPQQPVSALVAHCPLTVQNNNAVVFAAQQQPWACNIVLKVHAKLGLTWQCAGMPE